MTQTFNFNNRIMKMFNLNWKHVLFLIILNIKFKCSTAQYMKCPDYQIHFEKIIGFRPPAESSLSSNFGAAFEKKIIFRSLNVPSPISQQCLDICRKDYDCDSFVLNFNKSECYGYTSNPRLTEKFNFVQQQDRELVEDISVVYFVKTCLNIPTTCKSVLWPVLRIPGSALIGRGFLTVNHLVTRRECTEMCFFEKTFKCRSASFHISHRNMLSRTGSIDILSGIVLGQCILSKDDKNVEPEAFRVAAVNEEYIENNCNADVVGGYFMDDLCSYEHYPSSSLLYAEDLYKGLTDKECQEKCFTEKRYFCKGLSYQKALSLKDAKCLIHSEDVVSLGPRALINFNDSYYMKRVQCLNLTVRCSQTSMMITYKPRQYFQGRLYADKHSDECGVSGSNYGPTILNLPIGSQIKESRCGIHRAFDYEYPNRTLIFTHIIIQNNPLVQMQGDRYIKIGCISSMNRSSNGGLPDFISLEASVAFNGHKDYEGVGSLVFDSAGDLPKVSVFIVDASDDQPIRDAKIGQLLKLVISLDSKTDIYDFRAINLTASSETDRLDLIGSSGCPMNLGIFSELQKEQKGSSRQIYTKFKAFKFSSSTQMKFNVMIQFCYKICMPTNCGYNVVSNGRKRRNIEQRKGGIVTPPVINPIRFPDDPELRIETTTAAPLKPIIFPGPVENNRHLFEYALEEVQSEKVKKQGVEHYFGEIKQSIEDQNDQENEVQVKELDPKINEVKMSDILTIPLGITLNIVEAEINGTDRLVVGENDQLWVAGFGQVAPGTFCMDQSLLVAVLIFWTIFQVIILFGCCIMVRKYKRYVDVADDHSSLQRIDHNLYPDDDIIDRRVRWADQTSELTIH